MPQKRRRPSGLPESVRQRARFSSKKTGVAPGVETLGASGQGKSPGDNRAILVSDPSQTAPESPQRPEKPEPLALHQDSEIQASSVHDLDAESWYDDALSVYATPAHAIAPMGNIRGRVALKVTDSGLDMVSEGTDVAIHYENNRQRADDAISKPDLLPLGGEQVPEHDIAQSLVWGAGGFLVALFIVWILVLSAPRNEVIIISPDSAEVHPK